MSKKNILHQQNVDLNINNQRQSSGLYFVYEHVGEFSFLGILLLLCHRITIQCGLAAIPGLHQQIYQYVFKSRFSINPIFN